MRRDRKRKDTQRNKEYILAVMQKRMEHSCYKDRPKMRDFTVRENERAMAWDDFLDRFLVNIIWNEQDKRDRVYRGAVLVFKMEDGKIFLADTNNKVLALNREGCNIPLNDDLVWDLNYHCVFKFGDIVGNNYYDGSGTL